MLLIEAKVIFQFYDAVTDNNLKPPTLPVIALVLLKHAIKDFLWLSYLGKRVQQKRERYLRQETMLDKGCKKTTEFTGGYRLIMGEEK